MMNDPINFTDKDFKWHNSGACQLFIHLDAASYSFAIVDQEQDHLNVLVKKYFGQSSETFSAFDRLEILKAENDVINLAYARVKISVEAKAFTFVPEELYTETDFASYSKFIGAEPESGFITADIQPFGIKNITAVESDLENNLRQAFRNPLIFSQANPFISGVNQLVKNGNQSQLFLNFNRHCFEAAVIQGDTLAFYNIFDISTADEFNYYILNLISQLSIDRSLSVTVAGEISTEMDLYQRVEKYFGQIIFAKAPILGALPSINAPQRYFSLLSLDLCE